MGDLLAARLQMAFSLGFHIIFACVGMAMPFLMAIAHWRYIKTGDAVYKDLSKAWSKGVAIFFATGAVSGTVLSFELGLLWPEFMEHAGPIFGMPFSLEGTAFFIEAIALGLFLYGWGKIPKWIHWSSGLVVGISGVASGILVVAANAWMNSPTGFDYDPLTNTYSNIDPIAAMFNPAWFTQALHMILAAFTATGFAVAGVHAFLLIRKPANRFHQQAMRIALLVGGIAAFLQPISGDISAKDVAVRQPAKLAAMEAHFHTEEYAGLLIGGIPNEETGEVHYGIKIPGLLSFLAHGDFKQEVVGLDQIPEDERPPVAVTHFAFQIMVGAGTFLMMVAFLYFFAQRFRPRWLGHKNFLWLVALSTPLGMLAVEAGWTVTEVGRQPWIINGIMRTKEAVTPMPGIQYSFYTVVVVYTLLAVLVSWLMKRQVQTLAQNYDSMDEEIDLSQNKANTKTEVIEEL
ncbi:cytochrome ubiquinol oxidase subunit I [Saprospira grandis]|uniref:Cytochrome bd ubiquinol oxidase subunit I n=1 Tax=Saprospira grandis (strain Lewin) TaxID=984262 RepID=H6L283_SAPGL|nr:cytochrome ubiquinol oxidase subunit I [Saprospira grandis]AFC24721.1 cytochrome bd ubiquinol oxidase subunit I [Saprospira grandis str. Lewin]